MKLAIWVFGLAQIATGAVDLIWGALDPEHQPLQAWGDHVPGSAIYAYVMGIMLVAGGAAILSPRTRRPGAVALALVYLAVAIFWVPRLHTAPAILGQTPGVYVGILAGICAALIVVYAALIVYGGRITPAVRIAFGLCAIIFGLQHLLNLHSPNNTAMVPVWMPFGRVFWVVFTGAAFVLAGIAIVIRVADVLAAKLLALMLLVFSAVTLVPGLIAYPHEEGNWGGNFYEIVAAASAWIVAESLAKRGARSRAGE